MEKGDRVSAVVVQAASECELVCNGVCNRSLQARDSDSLLPPGCSLLGGAPGTQPGKVLVLELLLGMLVTAEGPEKAWQARVVSTEEWPGCSLLGGAPGTQPGTSQMLVENKWP